jgi:hypothetical protein
MVEQVENAEGDVEMKFGDGNDPWAPLSVPKQKEKPMTKKEKGGEDKGLQQGGEGKSVARGDVDGDVKGELGGLDEV